MAAFDSDRLEGNEMTIAIQINGKLRGKILVETSTSEEKIIEESKELENIKKYLEKENIKKTIYVPKNSLILLFDLKRIFLGFLLVILTISCGFKPLNYSEKKIAIFFEFQKNPLNFSLVQELKKNFFLMNANLEKLKIQQIL